MKRIAILAAATLVFACNRPASDRFEPVLSRAILDIERLRAQKDAGFAGIASIYDSAVGGFVVTQEPAMDTMIRMAIRNCSEGQAVHVNSQIIAKGLQKVVVGAMVGLMDKMDADPDAAATTAQLDSLGMYYECLSPTVVRRSGWIGKNRELDDQCRASIASLQNARGTNKISGLSELKKLLVRTYALSVVYELDGIRNHRGLDSLVCEEKEAEGRLFVSAVAPYVESDSVRALLMNLFSTGYRNLDVVGGRKLVTSAFSELNLEQDLSGVQ